MALIRNRDRQRSRLRKKELQRISRAYHWKAASNKRQRDPKGVALLPGKGRFSFEGANECREREDSRRIHPFPTIAPRKRELSIFSERTCVLHNEDKAGTGKSKEKGDSRLLASKTRYAIRAMTLTAKNAAFAK